MLKADINAVPAEAGTDPTEPIYHQREARGRLLGMHLAEEGHMWTRKGSSSLLTALIPVRFQLR